MLAMLLFYVSVYTSHWEICFQLCIVCACKTDARPVASLLSQVTISLRRHGVHGASPSHWGHGGEKGRIRETTLKRARISQLIFECCCCYFFFFFRAELYWSPNPESCKGKKKKKNLKKRVADEKSVWSWVEFKLLGLSHLPPHTRSL